MFCFNMYILGKKEIPCLFHGTRKKREILHLYLLSKLEVRKQDR